MDTLGDTYFLPEIAALTEEAAKQSAISFKVDKDKDNQEQKTLHEVWLQIQKNNIQALTLIYNQTLAKALHQINQDEDALLFQPGQGIPAYLVDPVILISGRAFGFHNFHEIQDGLAKAKASGHDFIGTSEPSVLLRDENKQRIVLRNNALRELHEVHIEQCKTHAAMSPYAQREITIYKNELLKQDAYWTRKEKNCGYKIGIDDKSLASKSDQDLQDRLVVIDEELEMHNEQRRQTYLKAKVITRNLLLGFFGACLVGTVALVAVLPVLSAPLWATFLIGMVWSGGALACVVAGNMYLRPGVEEPNPPYFVKKLANYLVPDIDKSIATLEIEKTKLQGELNRRAEVMPSALRKFKNPDQLVQGEALKRAALETYTQDKIAKEAIIQEKRAELRDKIVNTSSAISFARKGSGGLWQPTRGNHHRAETEPLLHAVRCLR